MGVRLPIILLFLFGCLGGVLAYNIAGFFDFGRMVTVILTFLGVFYTTIFTGIFISLSQKETGNFR
ncbi:MAG: hypothetical protein COU90_03290 [Candidatus Ryanbacteria bacterium CG10_big_fil_rev_8_21_14_0_10_43_42]|uniref:Uncharacterized protein n=1 Tax=Candidatus Ryanbacteria bacterium CG10_big_fil_rev_8_21_14_0_10_43_42 TaxID=1974864 RepID=A0A2M8KWY7_9BACT|nr:MAG: hypothetical protein COU90_03290 [Candidatus Ryanbacteria bacterium CG10_big_fil_rev_8_21_14_0_10_43_42]